MMRSTAAAAGKAPLSAISLAPVDTIHCGRENRDKGANETRPTDQRDEDSPVERPDVVSQQQRQAAEQAKKAGQIQ